MTPRQLSRAIVRAFAPAIALLAPACAIPDTMAPPPELRTEGRRAAVISDGATGGNGHFYFLTPLVQKYPRATGAFDPTRAPLVRITRGETVIAELPAVLEAAKQQYRADWKTAPADLDVEATYRLTVLVNGQILGFADLDVVADDAQLKSVATGEYIGLVDDRVLAIKFRIEKGAVRSGWRQLAGVDPGRRGLSGIAHHSAGEEIFAAIMPDFAVGALWRFDLRADSWSRMRADGWPIGKYRKLVHDPVHRRLLTYWDGLGQVYAIPDTGGRWEAIGGAPNREEWYEGFAFWDPVAERLTHFAGYGFGTWKNELWRFDDATTAWGVQPQGASRPSPTFGSPNVTAVDRATGTLFLGQRSLGAAPGNHDDLWKLDLASGEWTNLIAPSTGPGARISSALAFVPTTGELFRFGGQALDLSAVVGGLQRARPAAAEVSWEQVATSGAEPTARRMAGMFFDAPRNRLVLVSGVGSEWSDDVWAYELP